MEDKKEKREREVDFIYTVLFEDFLIESNSDERIKLFNYWEDNDCTQKLFDLLERFKFRHMIYAAGIAQRQYEIKDRFNKLGGIAYNTCNKPDWEEKLKYWKG